MNQTPRHSSEEMDRESIRAVAGLLGLERSPEMETAALRLWLADRIAALLDRQPELLMSHLYRIDVPEAAVQDVLQKRPPAEIPLHLADLMIERQLQKIETRRRYRAGE